MAGRVVIVTGASRGLGREVAVRFGLAGWAVAVNCLRDEAAADSAAAVAASAGGEAAVFKADVSVYTEVQAMVGGVLSRFGRIDVLVNNAGIARPGLIARLSEADWDSSLDINLKGAFNTTKAVSRTMMKQRSGHIVNISSIIGLRGKTGQAAYSASKAGLMGLTRAAAVELSPYGVQVNAVLPGYMLTDMGAAAPEKAREDALAENLLGRYSEPAEAAEFIRHLAGMRAVSGQVFNLDSRIA